MSGAPAPTPLFFGPAARPLFGWVHPGAADRPHDVAVVVCAPFGYEAQCAHRSLRHFARTAAEAGFCALRFDVDGFGDSAGNDLEDGRWEHWVASVSHAIDAAKTASGAARVIVLGVRLGATLAAEAARVRDDVEGLVAIAPVVSGKAWLREQRALQIALDLAPAPEGVPVPTGIQECVGYSLTEQTRDAITRVDLTTAEGGPANKVLIIDRDDRPPSESWAQHLRGRGAAVERLTLPGYHEMMLDPHNAQPPVAMLEVVRGWLDRMVASAAPGRRAGSIALTEAQVATGVIEEPVFLEESRTLFGIVARPAGVAKPTRAIVLTNSGASHHTGPNGLWVRLARAWAARGLLVLRLDLAGIGDSRPWPGAPENVVYPADHDRTVSAALAYLRGLGVGSVRGAGICSGAYHLIKAATAGHGFEGIVPINPLVFYWKDGMSLDYPRHMVEETTAQHKRSLLEWEKWRKLLTGGVDLIALGNVWARHLATLGRSWVRNIARAAGAHPAEDIVADLAAITKRGTSVRFIFSAGDPGQAILLAGSGRRLKELTRAGEVRITEVDGADHTFTPIWAQERISRLLEAELGIV